MKTNILLLFMFFAFSYNAINAQDYKPLVVEGNQWNELLISGPDKYFRTRVFKIEGDSIEGGIAYKKIVYTLDSLGQNWIQCGLIREDVILKKVYLKKANEPDLLLFDFGAQVGDVINTSVTFADIDINIRIDSIDTIRLGVVDHKRFYVSVKLATNPETEYDFVGNKIVFIEGIGCLEGLLETGNLGRTGVSSQTLCFYQNNELKYKNKYYSECYYWGDSRVVYKPLVVEGNRWNELLTYGINSYNKTQVFKIEGDSIDDGIAYKKIVYTIDSLGQNWIQDGLIREDVAQKKVYFKRNNEQEYLLYDFDVQPGDVIISRSSVLGDSINIRIDSVDAIRIDAAKYKKFYVSTKRLTHDESEYEFSGNKRIFIEGIGSLDGILQIGDPDIVGVGHGLLCFYRNDRLFLKNGADTSCYYWGNPRATYKPLLVEGNQWNVVYSWNFNEGAPIELVGYYTLIYSLDGDTIVGDVKYKRLIAYKDKEQTRSEYLGLIREDINEQKVFFTPEGQQYIYKGGEEYLLYDFGAQVGDVVFESEYFKDRKAIVTSIDYVYIGGVERKVLTVDNWRLWIEGIGGDDGFLSEIWPLDGSWPSKLLCFSQNNQLVYKPENPVYNDCFVFKKQGSDIEGNEIDNLNYTISISENNLLITSAKAEPFDVKIYNMLGSQVLIKTGNAQYVKIFTEGFTSGSYILYIVSEGAVFRKKIVI